MKVRFEEAAIPIQTVAMSELRPHRHVRDMRSERTSPMVRAEARLVEEQEQCAGIFMTEGEWSNLKHGNAREKDR